MILIDNPDFTDDIEAWLAEEWPNCPTPDCEFKQCTWSGLPLCFQCAQKVVGLEEMIRRFDATHDITWEEA